MSDLEVYEERDKVVNLYLEGKTDVQISKILGLKRNQVGDHLNEFKQVARSDDKLRDRGREVVHEYDTQQSRIIDQMWDVVREAESVGDLKVRAGTLKQLSDVQARRVEVLQRAGLIAENSITDELVATQEKVDIIMSALREIKNEHPEVAVKIANVIRRITGEVADLPVS